MPSWFTIFAAAGRRHELLISLREANLYAGNGGVYAWQEIHAGIKISRHSPFNAADFRLARGKLLSRRSRDFLCAGQFADAHFSLRLLRYCHSFSRFEEIHDLVEICFQLASCEWWTKLMLVLFYYFHFNRSVNSASSSYTERNCSSGTLATFPI